MPTSSASSSNAADAGDSGFERILVTGGAGFVGRHLRHTLLSRHPDWEILSSGRHGNSDLLVDVTDRDSVMRAVESTRPTIVVHLAALSAVTSAQRDAREAWDVNLGGTLNVVEAVRNSTDGIHLLYVSSSEVYGRTLATVTPTNEQALLEPLNPYAASKAAADLMVRQHCAQGLYAAIARPFNHVGAGQTEAFVAPAFASQIARIERGLAPPILFVGNLDEERDFLDVSDVTEAYLLMLERRRDLETGTVLNVSSGKAVRIGDLLERLLSLSTVTIDVRLDPARLRPAAISRTLGDSSRLRQLLNWRPTRSLDQTMIDVLNEQRALAVNPERSRAGPI